LILLISVFSYLFLTGHESPFNYFSMKTLFIVIAILLQETDARNPLDNAGSAAGEKLNLPLILPLVALAIFLAVAYHYRAVIRAIISGKGF